MHDDDSKPEDTDSAEKENIKEDVLLNTLLAVGVERTGVPETLKAETERFIEEISGAHSDFDVEDALVTQASDGTLLALPPNGALVAPQAHWETGIGPTGPSEAVLDGEEVQWSVS